MKEVADRLCVRGRNVRLDRWDPRSTPGVKNREAATPILARNLGRIDDLQYKLYAEGRRSLLIVLQGMDTSGKDGVVRKVMTAFNPQSCRVWAFKAPTPEELAHDFLWRIHKATPPRGGVSIFNRSHYEDVLIVRVHDLVKPKIWQARYDEINEFERNLVANGTRVIKFFLHISAAEQTERLLARLGEPDKHWKFNTSDLDERIYWNDYQRAYEDALERCSTDEAPWFVIPADRKWYRDWSIAQIVADTLEDMAPKAPKVKLDVDALRARLEGSVHRNGRNAAKPQVEPKPAKAGQKA